MIKPTHILLLFLVLGCHALWAAEFPPAHHWGEDLVVSDGDVIWGKHTGIAHFIVPTTATVRIKPYYPEIFGSGWIEIHAQEIIIGGTINASGSGYTGGGGRAGMWGPPSRNCVYATLPTFPGFPGIDGVNRYGGLWSDGPAHGMWDLFQRDGGYNEPATNTDATTDTTIFMGSGGEGGPGGSCACSYGPYSCWGGNSGGGGGGGGGSGGGAVILYAQTFEISGSINTNGRTGENGGNGTPAEFVEQVPGTQTDWCCTWNGGDGGDGGNADDKPSGRPMEGLGGINYDPGFHGGSGAGGGILLRCDSPTTFAITGTLDTRGGRDQLTNGGTIKIFHSGPLDLEAATTHTPRLFTRNLATDPLLDPIAWYFY